MSMYFITKGTCYLGENARFESDDNGGTVAVGEIDEESNEVKDGTVSVFGDWQASKYLGKLLEFVNPARELDIPDFKSITKEMQKAGADICDYCRNGFECRDCIVSEWKECET